MSEFIQITTATNTRERAEKVAAAVVERQLAGCGQIVGPVRSVYRWKGRVERADEWLCILKTRADLYSAVEAVILDLHSYENPEIIASPITAGSEAYLDWLGGETGG